MSTPSPHPTSNRHTGLCSLPGCQRPTQQSAGNGHSRRYCKHHVEFHRRHGSYWFKSLSARDLEPFRLVARRWLRVHQADRRVLQSLASIKALLAESGRSESAYSLRDKDAVSKARIALARLRDANVATTTILERLIAVTACCEAKGIDERQREYRHVQLAKSVHRLASGTHKTTSGFPIPSKYPRSEGLVLRHLGQWLDDIVAFALDNRDIMADGSLAISDEDAIT